MTKTNEELLQALRDYYTKHGVPPTKTNFPGKTTYQRRFGSWNESIKLAGLPVNYERHETVIVQCAQCNIKFPKEHAQIKKSNNNFCSQSCAAKYNNIKFIKRKKLENTKICCKCNKNITSKRNHKLCFDCKNNFITENNTLHSLSYIGANYAARYARIREMARKKYATEKLNGCQNCRYNKHVEVCHIKPIADFKDTDIIKDINCKSNIAILCKNCHWELDHKQLKLEDIKYSWHNT